MSTLRKLPAAAYWIFRSSRRTFRGILDAELSDERLKAIVSTLWVYAGLPPGRVFGLQVAGMLMSYGVFKPYYPRGGSGRLPLRLRDALIEAGGEVITGRAVAGLRVEGGRARGAELKGGDLLEADDVVGACDLNHLLDDLGAGRAMKPAYTERIHGLRPSVSPFRLFLGVEVGRERLAGIGFENLIFNSWDHERMYDRHLEMDIPFACVTVPSLIDEAAAPPGCQVVQIMTFAPYAEEEAWEKRKEEYARRLYDFVLQAIPGLAGPVRARLVLTPHDLRSRTNVTRGAMYGWEQSPEQSARGRPAQRTPLPGLYLAGQWTAPGPGCSQVLLSGLRAAHLIGKKR
jgi:prolycopene isomerase